MSLIQTEPKKICMFQSRLPAEYQEVEYIQSSGTQLIDTGYLITPNTEVAVDYQFINANNQDFVFGIGSDSNTSNGLTFCVYIGSQGGIYRFKPGLSNGTSSDTWNNSGLQRDTNRHTFVMNNGNLSVYDTSGTLEYSTNTVDTITRTAGHSFGLFCWWRTDISPAARSNKTAAKLYGCTVKESGTLQRNFVPCYRIADSVVGLYDTVNNQFYTNAGTGTFTKGNDVNFVEQEIKRVTIRPNGTEKQIRPTGWTPGANTLVYRPFAEDILDHSGNNRDLSVSGSAYSFTTNTQGLKCCSLNPSNSDSTYFTTSMYSIIDFTNNDYTFVCDICDFPTTLAGSWTQAAAFGLRSNLKFPLVNTMSGNSGTYGGSEFSSTMTWNGSAISFSYTGSSFVNTIYTRDHSTSRLSLYVDGQYLSYWACSGLRTPNVGQICKDPYGSGAARCVHGKIKDFIIEDKVRTATEVTNYYNSTR